MSKKKEVEEENVKEVSEEVSEEVEKSDDESKGGDEESLSDESEFFEDSFGEISEESFEGVSDFSIGDMGLATANTGGFWKGNLESSLAEEPSARWEERNEGREENNFYKGDVDERENGVYGGVEHGSDFYTGGGRGTDLYASDSGNYNAKDESGEFYDPRISKRAEIEEVREADRSKLEITGLQGGFGRGTEKDVRDKRKDKKYSN